MQLNNAAVAEAGIVIQLDRSRQLQLPVSTQGREHRHDHASLQWQLRALGRRHRRQRTSTIGFELDKLTIDPLPLGTDRARDQPGTGYSQLYERQPDRIGARRSFGQPRRHHVDRRQRALRQVRLASHAVELYTVYTGPATADPQHPDLVGGPGRLVLPGLLALGSRRTTLLDRGHRAPVQLSSAVSPGSIRQAAVRRRSP